MNIDNIDEQGKVSCTWSEAKLMRGLFPLGGEKKRVQGPSMGADEADPLKVACNGVYWVTVS